MHPTVWREKRLGREENKKLACQVLRLAPCLDWMLVWHTQFMDPSDCCDHLYTTDCALRSMELHCYTSFAAQAALLIQRQAFLGRLRRLQIKLITRETAEDSILFRTMALTPGLESLAITAHHGVDSGVPRFRRYPLSVHVPSSIKSVSFRFSGRESFVNFVLSKHAASLETALFSESASDSTLQLLAGLSRLRELTCRIQPGLQVLAASETLQALTMLVERETEEATDPADAVKLVRRAPRQLREFSLRWRYVSSSPHDHSADVAVELLRAAASGAARSRLERLSAEFERCRECPHRSTSMEQEKRELFDALLAALPALPALRELRVHAIGSYERLLRGLGAAAAPALRCLSVRACAHALLHDDDAALLAALLTARPSLHVRASCNHVGFEDKLPWSPTCGRCDACKLDCHPELRERGGVLLYPWRMEHSGVTSACFYREGHGPAPTCGPDCILVSV
ncbi:uncharacterized protein LOC113204630 isoform X2 [Frankliniella occidentalis]|nr:uncharacterized protein LOC113204630 isoform X2 [Frankliniella occidentalis]